MKESNKNNKEKVLLTDVSTKLCDARNLLTDVPDELLDFADYMASIIGDNEITPIGMAVQLTCALDDLFNGRCGLDYKIHFPEKLRNKKYRIIICLNYFPLIIDKIASKEFSEEFRTLFTEIFVNEQPPVYETKNNYGVTILEEGVVDISNKDKAEVLAALYNNSHPQGMGFLQYDPEPMNIEQAHKILKQTASFDYLFGRVMKISLESNIVHTSGYNRDNGDCAAEHIISQCHNIY